MMDRRSFLTSLGAAVSLSACVTPTAASDPTTVSVIPTVACREKWDGDATARAASTLRTALEDLRRGPGDSPDIRIRTPETAVNAQKHGRRAKEMADRFDTRTVVIQRSPRSGESAGGTYYPASVVRYGDWLGRWSPSLTYPTDSDSDGLIDRVGDTSGPAWIAGGVPERIPDRLADHNGDGGVDILDAVALYADGVGAGVPTPVVLRRSGLVRFAQAFSTVVHEFGHLFGLSHRAGEGRVVGDSYVVSPMLNGYARRLAGEENRAFETIPNPAGKAVCASAVFGQPVRENAGHWLVP